VKDKTRRRMKAPTGIEPVSAWQSSQAAVEGARRQEGLWLGAGERQPD